MIAKYPHLLLYFAAELGTILLEIRAQKMPAKKIYA
jgi:hypothetical protein